MSALTVDVPGIAARRTFVALALRTPPWKRKWRVRLPEWSAELTVEQGRALFDERARQLLGIAGVDFVGAWGAGELDRDDDDVLRVALLLPLAG